MKEKSSQTRYEEGEEDEDIHILNIHTYSNDGIKNSVKILCVHYMRDKGVKTYVLWLQSIDEVEVIPDKI